MLAQSIHGMSVPERPKREKRSGERPSSLMQNAPANAFQQCRLDRAGVIASARSGTPCVFLSSRAPEWNLKARTLPSLLGRSFAVAMIAVDHRAIGTGGDHAHASQREFHQKYFEPLTAVRAIIMGLVAELHGRL
jgi:hypothetical protein